MEIAKGNFDLEDCDNILRIGIAAAIMRAHIIITEGCLKKAFSFYFVLMFVTLYNCILHPHL